ncbi:YqhG family protein [Paenactinomyces guangxiensis]|uniref:Uncharacterized protein n=1 Tax=Paenactinomyces guangxiensis TaxID=1490290 RepID=A0A7W1WTF7_9BACL|nr:YqhG family protein [Paenactinomyces guangxiensis]MBA4495714.1 hypothetical protein [Paenactinomyces guangxiensis]MBH8592703.1 hypothetical protein [Paenactinomyces guangxiensis]
MDQKEIRSFTERYLQCHDCHIIESAPTHIVTQLSIHADKDLLNRPFYWMFVERMNMEPQPAQLCFCFDADLRPEHGRVEHLFYGSPRFAQMLNSAQKNGQFVRLYQQPQGWERRNYISKPYTPWLGINFKISYICDQKMDRISYVGINLQNGEVRDGFYQMIQSLSWTSKLPAQRHILSPRLTIPEAVGELEYYLQEQIENEDLTWADEAMQRLEAELNQLDSYYPDETSMSEETRKEKKQRRRETIWQYHPRVEIKTINSGLFYIEQLPESGQH